MIIDCILDVRDDPESYDAKEFYDYVMDGFKDFHYIARALDSGSNADVQKALCTYIDSQNYNPEIKDFVNSFDWLCTRVGYCVDIFSGNDDVIYSTTMTICALVKHSDGALKCEIIEDYSMSEDDMKVVTGINDIEEIESTSDLDLARIIAENSQPYGLVGLPDCVCDYYSAGITHYHDVKPQRLN